MTDEPSGSKLTAELRDLRARLAEAEEALRAIRDGEVDAVVVTGGRGEQVYTLTGADRIYRQLIETMSEGAVTLSTDGLILYCNARFAEMLGRPLDQVLGTAVRDYLPPADRQALDAMFAQTRAEPSRREINLTTSEGRLVPVYLSASHLRSEGAQRVFCLVLTDLTEQKRYEQIVAAERLARLILEQAAEAIVVCDEQGRIIRASHAAGQFCNANPLQRPFAEVCPLRTDASEPFRLAPVFQGETLRNVDVSLDRQGQTLDLILNAGPLLSGQQILGCVVTLTDITARKRSENELALNFETEAAMNALLALSLDGAALEDFLDHALDLLLSLEWLAVESKGAIFLADEAGKTLHLHAQKGFSKDLITACCTVPFGRCLCGRAAAARTVHFADRVDERHDTRCEGMQRHGHYCVPILSGDDILGVINLYVKEGHTRASWEEDFLKAVANTLAGVVKRKRTEEALRQSEERFRILFEQAADCILLLEMMPGDFPVIRDANAATSRLLGYERDDLIGQPVSFIDADLDASKAVDDRQHDIPSRMGSMFEVRHRCKDGTIRGFECSVTAMHIGSKTFAISVERDITERKRTERELHDSKQLVEMIVENVPLMIFLKEAQDLKFVVFNRAGEELLGYDRNDLLGRNNLDLFPPEQAAFFMAKDREVLAGRGLLDIPEEPILTAKKGQRMLHTRKLCIKGADGVAKYLLGISEDITDRKQADAQRDNLEEQLRTSQKMEAIGSLAGGVAHDFNNLLSVILSYTAFALENVRVGDPLRDDLLEVKRAGKRAAGLTRQLLAFSRKQVLQPVPLDLNQIAAGVENMLRRILGEDIDFVQVLAPDLGLTMADPGQIEQVIMNLVVNARDAMPRGGKLTIETANVEVDEEYAARHVAVNPGSYVQLAITDTGSGIDEQTRAHMFEPFFTTKEKGKGTGLGLSTAYGIVKQSGGNIWVYSEPGQGTTFKIYLPRQLSATTAPLVKRPSDRPWSTGNETVLVVEDEEALLKIARRALDAAGYTVLVAADGDEALRTSAGHAGDIHLLVTDVVMPRMSGGALADEFSKTRPTSKVLYMSGYTDDAIVHHGVLEAGTHFLAKPFTAADLTRKVREVLDRGVTNRAGKQAALAGAETEGQPLDSNALRALAPDLLGRLREAVIAARYGEIVEIIETIGTTQPDVAARLRRMADAFDYDGMRDLLSRCEEQQSDR